MGSDFDSDQTDLESVRYAKVAIKLDSIKRHRCQYEGCNSAFNRPWKLKRHINTHTKERPFKCDYPGCSKDYTNQSHLRRHKTLSHSENTLPPTFIYCPFPECKKVFSNKWNVKRHVNIHKNKNPYECSVCGESFRKHRQLKSHSYDHLGVLPFSCQTCKESFKTKKELERHERKHKIYICDYEGCGEQCITMNALRKHFKFVHPKTFTCDFCKKIFLNKYSLTEHVFSHLPVEKRDILLCTYKGCNRYYFHARNLQHHLKSYHRDMNWSCSFPNCGKKFVTKGLLKKHAATHDEPEKPKKPTIRKLPRKPRKDKGQRRKSIAAMLSGIVLPSNIDKNLSQRNITPEVLDCLQNVRREILSEEMNNLENVEETKLKMKQENNR